MKLLSFFKVDLPAAFSFHRLLTSATAWRLDYCNRNLELFMRDFDIKVA